MIAIGLGGFLFRRPRLPQQLAKRLDELNPILKLHDGLEFVEIVVDGPLDRGAHLHDLPDMRLYMAFGETHRLHPLLVVLLDQL